MRKEQSYNSAISFLKASICFILCLCISVSASAQKFSKSQIGTLDEARVISKTNPTEAIRLIKLILDKEANNKRRNNLLYSDAHELLGDINLEIGLSEQATTRYEEAIVYAKNLENKALKQRLYRKTAGTLLEANPAKAISYFDLCISIEGIEKEKYNCYEGKADGMLAIDSVELGIEIYKELEQTFQSTNDPSLARIQAKLANAYAVINKIPEAVLNYSNAQSNYSSQNTVDDKAFRKSAENISTQQNSVDQIQLRNSNIEIFAARPEKVAEEKLELIEVYVNKGENKSALEKLKEIRPILNTLPTKTKADYFKQSSEIFAIQGNYEQALSSYEKFQESNNILLAEKEKLLDNKIEINELQKTIDISEKENINKKDRESYEVNLVKRQEWIILLLGLLLLGAVISMFLIYRNIQSKNKANKLLELRSLRSEMNPHFIFNALGSVNNFIAEKDSRNANKFLSEFSKLMRSAMEMNKHDLIPLKEELEFSSLYLKLEHKRWEDKFDFNIDIDWDEIPEDLKVPPLLIQPYIENAVWHGLRYKDTKGKLLFQVKKNKQEVTICISDNGIGRKKSLELKTNNQLKYKSTGLRNTQKRTSLINSIYKKNYHTSIGNKDDNSIDKGTVVKLILKS